MMMGKARSVVLGDGSRNVWKAENLRSCRVNLVDALKFVKVAGLYGAVLSEASFTFGQSTEG
jgi:hypothetical protein